MKPLSIGMFLSGMLAVSVAAAAAAPNPVITQAIDGFVRPAYGQFHQATVALEADMRELCAEPVDANLVAARGDFVSVVRSWSEVETIRFGPVTEDNRLERILFWPDRKSIGLKQVQKALAERDPTAAEVSTLTSKSVAMQGLGALEFVLFGANSDELSSAAGAYRCSYGRAIATNLQTMAADISGAWADPDGVASQWANPGPGNALYRSDDEALTELFNIFVHGLEMVRDVRLNGFLADNAEDDKPKQAIYWRSGATIVSVKHQLDGLKQLFDASDLASLLDADNGWMPASVDFEFANAHGALEAVDGSVADALADSGKRKKLTYARLVTSSLTELFGVRLAGALGLSAGFSSLDGD